MENWKQVYGYEGLYEVSDLGKVRGLTSGKLLAPYKGSYGYLRVDLHKNGNKKTERLHRLVLEAFKGPPSEGYQCRHLNHNKEDCSLVNLEWNTQQVNIQDNLDRGACNAPKGEEHYCAKMTWDNVREMRTLSLQGWNTSQLCRKYGLAYTTAANIVNHRTWKEQL